MTALKESVELVEAAEELASQGYQPAQIIQTLLAIYSEEPPAGADPVNHPAHYTSHPSGVECIQVVEHMGFNLGNAIKYIWRADEKGNALEDLQKAGWYVARELERRLAKISGGLESGQETSR